MSKMAVTLAFTFGFRALSSKGKPRWVFCSSKNYSFSDPEWTIKITEPIACNIHTVGEIETEWQSAAHKVIDPKASATFPDSQYQFFFFSFFSVCHTLVGINPLSRGEREGTYEEKEE